MVFVERIGRAICNLRVLLLVFAYASYWEIAGADPRTNLVRLFCMDAQAASGSTLAINFVPAMDSLNSNVSAHGYGTAVVGQDPNAVYGLGQCLEDLSSVDCKLCFAEVRSLLPKCYPRIGGRIYLDGCFGRYGNYSFFDATVDSQDTSVCNGTNHTSNPESFGQGVRKVIGNVTSVALQNQGYAVGSGAASDTTAYVLAQCWESLNSSLCSSCLNAAAASVATCVPATEGRALFAGCYIRYSTRLFWNVQATGASSSGSNNVLWIVLGSCLGVFLLVVIVIGILVWKKRIFWRKKNANSLIDLYGDGLPARIVQSSLNFKYEDLKKATNNFDEANKLGQGSYGTVYKAVLPDGKEVAVKRLFLSTRQWIDQFFNEVDLVSQVRHKNLVKLLGCSVNGPESLLIYEYYQHRSVDLFLFGANHSKILTWEQRVDIIQGVAEGLSYLHEESETRIIHRDIKASNILLDDKLKPKITDFGLARAFSEDKTHLTTGVAGTLGYMAPEYVVHGHLTEKADVFSFGMLVIELVTGKKCGGSVGSHGGHLLLIKAWNHYKANTIENIVDGSIYDESLRDEIMHILQIGLLCTQASPGDRPAMAKVVELLRSHRHDLELVLTDPPFLNVETVQGIREGEDFRLLSTSAPSLSISQSHLSGR